MNKEKIDLSKKLYVGELKAYQIDLEKGFPSGI